MTINKRFLDELFVRGEVRLSTDIYKKYFSEIWVCPDTFIHFLKAEGSQTQKALAIEIAKQLADSSELTIPHSVFRNLVEVEHQGEDCEYIAQDHVVHSVNIYILGIYLYFNYLPLQRQIIHYFANQSQDSLLSPMEYAVSAFISSWKMFSIYHDIGYVLERAVDQEGLFKPSSRIKTDDLMIYQNTTIEQLYTIVIQSLARYLFANCIFKTTGVPLSAGLEHQNWIRQRSWKTLQPAATLDPRDVQKALATFRDLVELRSICSADGLAYISPFLEEQNILTVLKDASLRPVCFRHTQCGTTWVCYDGAADISEEIALRANKLSASELEEAGLSCCYYISSETAAGNLPDGISYFRQSMDYLVEQCYKRFEADFTLMFDEEKIRQILFEITAWIQQQVPLTEHYFATGLLNSACSTDAYDSTLKQIMCRMVTDIVNAEKITNCNVSKQIDRLAEVLNSKLLGDSFKEDFREKCASIINQNTDYNCQSVLAELIHTILTKNTEMMTVRKPLLELIPSIECPDRVLVRFRGIHSEIFSGSRVMGVLEGKLKKYAERMNIAWDSLMSYAPNYTVCDHSIVSGTLFLECLAVYSEMMEKLGNHPLYRSLWMTTAELENRQDDFLLSKAVEEACFSILLHNIYINDEQHQYGIPYMQDMAVNAFSYFSAFCDSLQFWDRPKLINLAKINQPKNTYNGRDYDLRIEGDKICILCKTGEAKDSLLQKIQGLDTFMKHASKMVRVMDTP